MKHFILAVIITALFMSGCCGRTEKCAADKSRVIVRINDYDLTLNDFQEEARFMLPDKLAASDAVKAKEDALDKLITKKILLQEAQRESFDKDQKFMKEIERYWEQALLKLLINKKIDDFSKKLPADLSVEDRQKMLQDELTKWVSGLRASAKVRIYRENLK